MLGTPNGISVVRPADAVRRFGSAGYSRVRSH